MLFLFFDAETDSKLNPGQLHNFPPSRGQNLFRFLSFTSWLVDGDVHLLKNSTPLLNGSADFPTCQSVHGGSCCSSGSLHSFVQGRTAKETPEMPPTAFLQLSCSLQAGNHQGKQLGWGSRAQPKNCWHRPSFLQAW